MWLQRWLGELYSKLYTTCGRDTITLDEITRFAGSSAKARVAVSRLKKAGLIYVFSVAERRKRYIVGDPILIPYLAAGRITNLDAVKQSRYAKAIGLFSAEALDAYPAIKSIIVYGSVSRGVASNDSDIDLLVLMDSDVSVGERIQDLSRVQDSGRTSKELDWLDSHEIWTRISILPLTKDEATSFPPILLDVLEDGIPVVDDGTFLNIKRELHARLVEAGARREFLSPNEWYWDLAPRLTAGEVYAL
jgi:predicted nucleotidyltransferase